jgi:hypothetical protein
MCTIAGPDSRSHTLRVRRLDYGVTSRSELEQKMCSLTTSACSTAGPDRGTSGVAMHLQEALGSSRLFGSSVTCRKLGSRGHSRTSLEYDAIRALRVSPLLSRTLYAKRHLPPDTSGSQLRESISLLGVRCYAARRGAVCKIKELCHQRHTTDIHEAHPSYLRALDIFATVYLKRDFSLARAFFFAALRICFPITNAVF